MRTPAGASFLNLLNSHGRKAKREAFFSHSPSLLYFLFLHPPPYHWWHADSVFTIIQLLGVQHKKTSRNSRECPQASRRPPCHPDFYSCQVLRTSSSDTSCKSKRYGLLYCGQAVVRIPQEKSKTTLTSYCSINFPLPSLNPVKPNWTLQSYGQPCHFSLLFSFFFLSLLPWGTLKKPTMNLSSLLTLSCQVSQWGRSRRYKESTFPCLWPHRPGAQPWQELCWPLRSAHTSPHRAAKMLQCRANIPGRRQGCILIISLRKYLWYLTAEYQFWLPPGGFQMEICSVFCQRIHPRQPCQKLPSSGKTCRHTAKVPWTLASRFFCSPIPQTLRLLHCPLGKFLVAQGIHRSVCGLPGRWNY